MIKITITSVKVDYPFVEEHPELSVGDTAYYVIRKSGKRVSAYYDNEDDAILRAWDMVKQYGLTLVEPW